MLCLEFRTFSSLLLHAVLFEVGKNERQLKWVSLIPSKTNKQNPNHTKPMNCTFKLNWAEGEWVGVMFHMLLQTC